MRTNLQVSCADLKRLHVASPSNVVCGSVAFLDLKVMSLSVEQRASFLAAALRGENARSCVYWKLQSRTSSAVHCFPRKWFRKKIFISEKVDMSAKAKQPFCARSRSAEAWNQLRDYFHMLRSITHPAPAYASASVSSNKPVSSKRTFCSVSLNKTQHYLKRQATSLTSPKPNTTNIRKMLNLLLFAYVCPRKNFVR